jgi:four helix bundle protein
MSSYKDLDIWKMSRDLVIDIHKVTMVELPKFELYEVGSQIRRSMKSVKANIVEGYGRRRYKQDFIRLLVYSFSSLLETTDHLETLYETGSLTNEDLFNDLKSRLDILGRKLNLFIQSVERNHKT